MKNFLTFAILLLLASAASASTRISATLTITNAPTTNGMSLTAAGSTRIFTNTPALNPAIYVSTNATVGGSTTNLFLNLARYRLTAPINITYAGTNAIKFQAGLDQALTLSIVGDWASVSYATQLVATPFTVPVRVPLDVESPTNAVLIANMLWENVNRLATTNRNLKVGGLTIAARAITADTVVSTNDLYLGVDTTAGAVTVTLTNASRSSNSLWIVKDQGGAAATNNITIALQSGDRIDGTTNRVLTNNFESVLIVPRGTTNFYTVGGGGGSGSALTFSQITNALGYPPAFQGANLGTSNSTVKPVFAGMSGTNLQFYMISVVGSYITSSMTSTSTVLTVTQSGETNTISSLATSNATVKPVNSTKSGVNFPFYALKAGTNVTLSMTSTAIVVNASAPAGIPAFTTARSAWFIHNGLDGTNGLHAIGDAVAANVGTNVAVAPTDDSGAATEFQQMATNYAGFSGNAIYRTGRNLKLAARLSTVGWATDKIWLGFFDTTLAAVTADSASGYPYNPTNLNVAAFRQFICTNGTDADPYFMAVTADGSGVKVTSTGLEGYSAPWRLFEIIFDDSVPKVTFKIDGAVVATHTNNLPSASTNLRVIAGQAIPDSADNGCIGGIGPSVFDLEWLTVQSDK
jgi:hypothetical protein